MWYQIISDERSRNMDKKLLIPVFSIQFIPQQHLVYEDPQ